jgi:hypothetical protein
LALLAESKAATDRDFPAVWAALEQRGWNPEVLAFPDEGVRAKWPSSLDEHREAQAQAQAQQADDAAHKSSTL